MYSSLRGTASPPFSRSAGKRLPRVQLRAFRRERKRPASPRRWEGSVGEETGRQNSQKPNRTNPSGGQRVIGVDPMPRESHEVFQRDAVTSREPSPVRRSRRRLGWDMARPLRSIARGNGVAATLLRRFCCRMTAKSSMSRVGKLWMGGRRQTTLAGQETRQTEPPSSQKGSRTKQPPLFKRVNGFKAECGQK